VLLELARASNLPTCVTNALVGAAIGAQAEPFPWRTALVTATGVSLLYVGGMALNDVVDAPNDGVESPDRPIPSGRISRRAALAFAVTTLAAGAAVCATTTLAATGAALALVAAIVLYDLVHKKTVHAIWIMGLCRGLVYATAALAVTTHPDWKSLAWIGTAMVLYISAVTFVARREHTRAESAGPPWLHLLLLVALLPGGGIRPEGPVWPPLAAGAAFVLLLIVSSRPLRAAPPRIGEAVMMWLAGICLADAYYLALLDRPGIALVAAALFVVTMVGHRLVRGT
jgi:4-hydroxybenzoate polyprenyltransferase